MSKTSKVLTKVARRKEFPNLAIVAVLLRSYVSMFVYDLDRYETAEEKLEAVRNSASDDGNEEIEDICNFIERNKLTQTFFRSGGYYEYTRKDEKRKRYAGYYLIFRRELSREPRRRGAIEQCNRTRAY